MFQRWCTLLSEHTSEVHYISYNMFMGENWEGFQGQFSGKGRVKAQSPGSRNKTKPRCYYNLVLGWSKIFKDIFYKVSLTSTVGNMVSQVNALEPLIVDQVKEGDSPLLAIKGEPSGWSRYSKRHWSGTAWHKARHRLFDKLRIMSMCQKGSHTWSCPDVERMSICARILAKGFRDFGK